VSKENTAIDAAETFKDRATTKQKVQTTLHNYPWLSSAAVLIAAVFVFNFGNENFLTTNNLSLILQQTAVIGAIAAGQTLIILTAGIDLSCGAIAIFASMVMAKTAFVNGWPGWAAFLLGIAVGTGAGAFNGWLITKVDLPSIEAKSCKIKFR
jgi:fructose transport system permease protein